MSLNVRPTAATRTDPGTVRIAPLTLVATDPPAAAAMLCAWAAEKDPIPRHVHLINAYTLALLNRDPALPAAFGDDAINFADGKPLATAIRLAQGRKDFHQIRGPHLFTDTFDQGRQLGLRHFLLGSTPEVLALLRKNLEATYPGIVIAGTLSPPFRPLTEEEIAVQDHYIAETSPDIVWVGLGTPKQDLEALRLAHSLQTLCVAIGAAFDFTAGTTPEAPRWMSTLGLEWFFRLSTEPRRLWRRYLIGNLAFMYNFLAGAYGDPKHR